MSRCLWYAPRLRFPLRSSFSTHVSPSLLFFFSLSSCAFVMEDCVEKWSPRPTNYSFSSVVRFPTDLSPFLQTGPVTTVLECIRKANVIIHARILGVPLRHVWEPVAPASCCIVGGSCKLLLYSVCHFHNAGIKFPLSSLRYFYGPCINPYIYDSQAALDLPIILLYKFIPWIF